MMVGFWPIASAVEVRSAEEKRPVTFILPKERENLERTYQCGFQEPTRARTMPII